ncbi:hypothetical protein AVDCRST_MAG84-4739 [uncultured Microcoleus sp.]|uniref:Uncharacterized protein n=1 Tax=uncultured Microcoleus sp. TaxID=259945 RepID=A0A6J4N8T0_9CYAN|nr:hypothetical protein AVDCRST_MAG84-4739 [uncultured Microcoleus sp.]
MRDLTFEAATTVKLRQLNRTYRSMSDKPGFWPTFGTLNGHNRFLLIFIQQ